MHACIKNNYIALYPTVPAVMLCFSILPDSGEELEIVQGVHPLIICIAVDIEILIS